MTANRDLNLYFDDILGSIEKVRGYTNFMSERDFYEDTQVQDAVLRRLEIIGEAVKKIPEDVRQKQQSIPWKQVAGMRDVLIHEYFGVQFKRVWKVIQEDLDELELAVRKLQEEM